MQVAFEPHSLYALLHIFALDLFRTNIVRCLTAYVLSSKIAKNAPLSTWLHHYHDSVTGMPPCLRKDECTQNMYCA